jgi:hypothetical protein
MGERPEAVTLLLAENYEQMNVCQILIVYAQNSRKVLQIH